MVRTNEVAGMKLITLGACILAGSLGAGCSSSDSANIGDGELAVNTGALASYAANWSGYVEAYSFNSGTDRVHVTLDEQGNGWLQIGDGDVLPPPNGSRCGLARRGSRERRHAFAA